MKKVNLSILLIFAVLTLSACNRGYGCPYGMRVNFSDIFSFIPFF